ncbi:hypothetical protein [Pseudorhodoferax sp. Leaf267]|uniref:hypothetical protein n=1 Tax=Pseudorhodoferax sp. Leaf267 TaxID=1736316 RepID=UPI0006FE4455|nr:hypothetical protein [Pseudorhodoferax sp. Leaf267]KQP12649.1 hypothetical protein ASF43_20645 [Pseudorhodoferax sp. Leaf267]
MSRLPWREAATVWVAPSQVGVALRRRGWRRAPAQPHAAPVAAGSDALQALARLAADAAPAQAHTRIVVSNRFVRTALLPHGQALRGANERHLAAREVLRSTHGDAVDTWTVTVDGQGSASTLAAGLDAGWLASLLATGREAGLHAVSVRPLLAVAAASAWPHLAGREAWLLVTEPDGAMLARIDAQGAWRSLRSAHEGPAAWAQWLARCSLLDGLAPASLPLVHVAWDWAAPAAEDSHLAAAGWDLKTVPLGPGAVWA